MKGLKILRIGPEPANYLIVLDPENRLDAVLKEWRIQDGRYIRDEIPEEAWIPITEFLDAQHIAYIDPEVVDL